MIRTIALVGHSGSGKTTLGEALLVQTGARERPGRVEEGSTTSDYTPEERAHGFSVRTAVLPLHYREHQIFLLDAPGYADFVGEIRGALEAADAAVVTVSAEAGVQVGTERAWTVAQRLGVARMVVITRLDRGGDFGTLLADLQATLGNLVPVHLPIYEGDQLVGIIDVLHHRAYRYHQGKAQSIAIPADQSEAVARYQQLAQEAIIETDERLLASYLEGGEVAEGALSRAFHEAVRRGLVYPVALACAPLGLGTDLLLELFLEALPSPQERFGEGSPLAKVFKVQVDPFVGHVAYLRLYRGQLQPGDTLQSDGGSIKLSHLYLPRGKELLEVDQAVAGSLLALPKADQLHRGMVLWTGSRPESDQIPFARLPEPNVFVALSPEQRGDEARLGEALHKLLEEDPSFHFERQPDTNEMLLWGHGDLHLETGRERLGDYGVKVAFRPPRIPYRETIRKSAEGQGKHKKQTGGHGQYGDVWLRLEPAPEFSFEWRISGGVIPSKYASSIEEGIRDAAQHGVLAGFPMIGFRAAVYHGSYHDVDSSDMAFQTAGALAFRQVAAQAAPVLMEPVYALKVYVSGDRVGEILSDLQGRRGRVLGMEQEGALSVVLAQVPLAELLEYSRALSGLTQGTGAYTIEFDHYAELPAQLASKVIQQKPGE